MDVSTFRRFNIFALLLACVFSAAAAADSFLLIDDDLSLVPVELRSINNERIRFADPDTGSINERSADRTLALLRSDGAIDPPRAVGWLMLADGQQFPGMASDTTADNEQSFAWEHDSFGRFTIPLDAVDSVQFDPEVTVPESGAGDVILLRNGDTIEGFLVSLSDPVVIEVDDKGSAERLSIDRDRIAAVKLITPARESTGKRLWLSDGTILDVLSIHWPEQDRPDIELIMRWEDGTQRLGVRASRIAAMSFDGARLAPLAAMQPMSVDGPSYRFRIPPPRALDRKTLLGLSTLELRGPLTVRYALPEGAARFAAEISVPKASRNWSDFDIIVRINGDEVHRQRLDAARPEHSINVPINGRELTIELTDGTNGSIRNHVHLRRPRVLIE